MSSIAVKLGIDNKRVKKIIKTHLANKEDEVVLKNEAMMIVAQNCGESTAIHLMQEFPLHTIYVPKNGFLISIKKYIIRNFNGYNHQTLALRCNVTERYVRSVIADMYAAKAQLSLDLFS
jgi:Mor family transcriptional regulator